MNPFIISFLNCFSDFSDKTFRAYLEHKRLTPNLIHYILYAIGMSCDHTSCSDGVNNVKRFLKSLGRYGNTKPMKQNRKLIINFSNNLTRAISITSYKMLTYGTLFDAT